MGTRSNIVVKRANGTFTSTYCHYDGYLKHNGVILIENYSSQKLVENLQARGDLRSLDKFCDAPIGHTYNTPADRRCVAFKDRGDKDVDYTTFDTLEDAVEGQEEYLYYWDGETWFVTENGVSGFKPLETALNEAGIKFTIPSRAAGTASKTMVVPPPVERYPAIY